MSKQSVRRKRGVILSERGIARVQDARRESEFQENEGNRFTIEALSNRTGLDPHTLTKIFNREVGVDKQTLNRYFSAFELILEADDYLRPKSTNGKMLQQSNGSYLTFANFNDRGEAPDVSSFCGRTSELDTLKQWTLTEQCRVVVLSGQGGIGKTFLSVKLIEKIKSDFNVIIWRSLLYTPPIQDFLTDLLEVLPDLPKDELSKDKSSQSVRDMLSLLIRYLRSVRCLLVLDGVEQAFHCDQTNRGNNREDRQLSPYSSLAISSSDYGWYQQLLKQMGEVSHQSCVVLTTRWEPQVLEHLVGENLPVRTLRLDGFDQKHGQQYLCSQGSFEATSADWEQLIGYYDGNPFFLKIVSITIKKLFNNRISDFLSHDFKIHRGIRKLLEEQFKSLSEMEWRLIYSLAQQQDSISLPELCDRESTLIPLQNILEALEILEGRSLIARNNNLFYLGPVVKDYVLESFQKCHKNPIG
jgi:hypothetical protein